LHSGDKISIGKYTILYEEGGGSREAAVSASIAEPVKQQAREYIGSTDMSYVHRTTEPRMRAIPEKPVSDNAKPEAAAGNHPEKEYSGAVLIETNKHVVYKIDKKYLTMGSSEEDDIFVSGFMVGDHQVAIEVQPEGIVISTGKLMGKLKINGKPKRHHILQHKDRIEVGSSTFRFMENG
jgi:hypothetical protein